jgi:hypothetical protein
LSLDSLLRLVLVVGITFCLQFIVGGLWRRYSAGKLRRAYTAAFDLRREQAELDEYVDIVRRALSSLRHEPIVVPARRVLDDQWLAEAVAAGSERFGIPLTDVTYRFVPKPSAPNAAGCASRPSHTAIRLEGDRAIISRLTGVSDVWTVEVADRYRSDPEVALVIVGHELAHVALLSRGVRLTPAKRNERLTDVAAALAGFGTLMLRVAQREQLGQRHNAVELKVGAVGYLHRDAIAYLHTRYLAPAS